MCIFAQDIINKDSSMREKIDCFLPQGDATVMEEMAAQLQNSKAVQNVITMETGLMSSNALMQVAENAKSP